MGLTEDNPTRLANRRETGKANNPAGEERPRKGLGYTRVGGVTSSYIVPKSTQERYSQMLLFGGPHGGEFSSQAGMGHKAEKQHMSTGARE